MKFDIPSERKWGVCAPIRNRWKEKWKEKWKIDASDEKMGRGQ